jgi:hypothetical protein
LTNIILSHNYREKKRRNVWSKGVGSNLHTIKRIKDKQISHILRRNYLLKHDIEGMVEGRRELGERRGRRRKQLMDSLKEEEDSCT